MRGVLSKMIILEPEIYKKLQQNVAQVKNLTHLDKMMNKILRNPKISVNKKWYLYRQQLIKYALLRRNSIINHPNSIKTKVVAPTKQTETQTTPTVEYSDNDDLDDLEEDGHTGSLSTLPSPPKPRLIRSADPSINLSDYGIVDEMNIDNQEEDDGEDEENIEDLFSTPKWSTSTPKPEDMYRLAFLNQQAENEKYYNELARKRDEAVDQVYEIKEPSPEKKKIDEKPKAAKRKILNSPLPNLGKKEKSPIALKRLKQNISYAVGTPTTSAGLYRTSRAPTSLPTRRVTRALSKKQQQQPQKGGKQIKWQRL